MTSTINVTKLAAAERQLREAIRMFFEQRDELATHTVASAAYRILRDLLAKTGRNEAAEVLFAPIFYVVRDYRRGTLPLSFQTHPEVMKYVKELAQDFPMINASHEFKDFEIGMDGASTKQYWDNFNNAANFLKHADRDPEGTLDPGSIDNFQLLFAATAAYAGVAEKRLEPDFDVMMIYYGLEYGRIDYLEKYLQGSAEDNEQEFKPRSVLGNMSCFVNQTHGKSSLCDGGGTACQARH